MAQEEEQLRLLNSDKYAAVDIFGASSTFHAVKKFLGPDGPFNLHSNRYTMYERKNVNSTRSETTLKKTQTQLVLGFGLHQISFRDSALWIHYRAVESKEQITVFCENTPEPEELPPVQHIQIQREEVQVENGENGENEAKDVVENVQIPVPSAPPALPPAYAVLNLFLLSANEYQHKTENDFVVVLSLNEDTLRWDNEIVRPKRPIESVVLSKGVKEELLADLANFRSDKQFYRSHGIPYKRGYLLHGPPGCGKTSLITAIASNYDLTICPIPIANPKITDNVIVSLMTSAPPDSIIVIEDIDILFPTHTNGYPRTLSPQGVTYSGLINALDGVTSTEDKIIIMTTNFRERLNMEALMRPGRIDKIIHITYADSEALYELFLQYYPEKRKKANLFRNFIVGRHIPTAYIQSYFLKHKGSPKAAWDDCEHFVDEYEKDLKETEERRKRQDEEKKKMEGGNSSYFRLF